MHMNRVIYLYCTLVWESCLALQIIQIGWSSGAKKAGLVGWLPKLAIRASLQLVSAKVGLSLGEHTYGHFWWFILNSSADDFGWFIVLVRFANNRILRLAGKKTWLAPKFLVFCFCSFLLIAPMVSICNHHHPAHHCPHNQWWWWWWYSRKRLGPCTRRSGHPLPN